MSASMDEVIERLESAIRYAPDGYTDITAVPVPIGHIRKLLDVIAAAQKVALEVVK